MYGWYHTRARAFTPHTGAGRSLLSCPQRVFSVCCNIFGVGCFAAVYRSVAGHKRYSTRYQLSVSMWLFLNGTCENEEKTGWRLVCGQGRRRNRNSNFIHKLCAYPGCRKNTRKTSNLQVRIICLFILLLLLLSTYGHSATTDIFSRQPVFHCA